MSSLIWGSRRSDDSGFIFLHGNNWLGPSSGRKMEMGALIGAVFPALYWNLILRHHCKFMTAFLFFFLMAEEYLCPDFHQKWIDKRKREGHWMVSNVYQPFSTQIGLSRHSSLGFVFKCETEAHRGRAASAFCLCFLTY